MKTIRSPGVALAQWQAREERHGNQPDNDMTLISRITGLDANGKPAAPNPLDAPPSDAVVKAASADSEKPSPFSPAPVAFSLRLLPATRELELKSPSAISAAITGGEAQVTLKLSW